tara:strand:+ start:146 stop:406 length:261 start_codon:yes stop_codon:yes gene_type:complete
MVTKKDRDLQLMRDYAIVFDSPEGTRVLHDIMLNNFILEPSFDDNPYKMAFNEGGKNAALRILSLLKYKPDDYVRLATETIDHGNG